MHYIDPWTIYYIQIADILSNVLLTIFIISGMILLILTLVIGEYSVHCPDANNAMPSIFKYIFLTMVISSGLWVLVPSGTTVLQLQINDKSNFKSIQEFEETYMNIVDTSKRINSYINRGESNCR